MSVSEPRPERHREPWTEKEDSFLQYHWGERRVQRIAKDLRRTPSAIVERAIHLKLGPFHRGTMSLTDLAGYSGFSVTKIKQTLRKLNITIPHAWSAESTNHKIARCAVDEDVADKVIKYMLDCPRIFLDKPKNERTTRGRWGVGKKPQYCRRCKTNQKPHYAKGLCLSCATSKYKKKASRKKSAERKKKLEVKHAQVLEIRNLRFMERLPYKEIGDRYGLKRTAVWDICHGKAWKEAGGPVEPFADDPAGSLEQQHSDDQQPGGGREGDP